MHNILKTTKILVLLFSFLFIIGCDDNDDNSIPVEGTNSIVNYLEKDSTFSLFSKAINRAQLSGLLNGNSGTYTVLAPNNEAMKNYLHDHEFNTINEIPIEQITRLVKYHILETLKPADDFVTSYVQTMATFPVNDSVQTSLTLYVNTTDGVEFNGKSKITKGDIPVDNGILHKVSKTLSLPTLKTFMTADENLNAFYNKITAEDIPTNFEDLLSNPDRRTTIFVPNETAINEFFSGEGNSLTPTELNKLYRYHLLDTLRLSTNLRTGYLKTKAKEDYSGNSYPLNLYVNTQAGILLNTGKTIVIPDIMTINGDIQVTDSVLTLPSVKTFIESDLRFKDFKNQLSRDDLIPQHYLELLQESPQEDHAPFTVFVPDNEAFDDLVTELYPDENVSVDTIPTNQMKSILDLHILEQTALRTEDFSNQNLNTLGGAIEMHIADTTTITDPSGRKSEILEGNFQAENGVIHHINKVLLPN